MEEDEIGIQRLIGHDDYVECSRCGQLTPKGAAEAVPGDALEAQADYELVCPLCLLALADGEQDLALLQP